MIHLDTSFLIRALVPGSSEGVRLERWVREDLPVRMSSIAWTEFLCGPVDAETARLAERVVGESVSLATRDAELAASLCNQSGRRRGALNDCMIAATAIIAGAELATSDRVEFERFRSAGLELAS